MSLQIELQGHGAGRAMLRVSGDVDTPESAALLIQRNDGLYLSPGQNWQTSPHWYPQFNLMPRPGGLATELGAEIVDGIIDAGGTPLKVSLRMDDREESAVLRIRGELIGSGAAAPPPSTDIPPEPTATPETEIPGPSLKPEPESESDATTNPPPILVPEPERRTRRSKKSPWVLVLLLLILLGATAGGWYLGLFAPLFNDPKPTDEPLTATSRPPGETDVHPDQPDPSERPPEPQTDESTSERPTTLPQAPVTGPDPAPLTGIAFVRDFLAGNPAPEAIFAQGDQAEQAGDCDAALVLFNTAANQDPTQAAKLAARYDPQGFEPGACIKQADAPYAIIFYGDAAATGAIAAQRRLGQLLTAREASGPTFEEGMEWLRQAAAAGDPQARASLAELEQRP